MTKEDGDRWQLNDQDRSSIKDLIRAVRSLTPAAMSGDCLIGLGEVWAALEGILDDSEIEINVQLEVGFRSGNADFDEGIFANMDVSWEGISLTVLHTQYERSIGSDHSTEPFATIQEPGNIDAFGVQRWLEELNQIKSNDDCSLRVERNL